MNKKAPRGIDNVSWAIGKSFAYLFLFTNPTKLFKRQEGYYILNPSGDLGPTEDRFSDWSKDM